jgi:hypothetical protein
LTYMSSISQQIIDKYRFKNIHSAY